MTHPTDEELEEQFSDEIEVALDPMGAWKLITYLRAQFAEARAERDVWEIDAKRNHQAAEIEFARADRAEAALAAQIEDACAVVDAHSEYDQSFCCDGRECGCQGASVHDMMKHFIRQPRDRTALDRLIADTEAKALRDAARTVWSEYDEKDARYWGESSSDIARREKARAILAMIDKEIDNG